MDETEGLVRQQRLQEFHRSGHLAGSGRPEAEHHAGSPLPRVARGQRGDGQTGAHGAQRERAIIGPRRQTGRPS